MSKALFFFIGFAAGVAANGYAMKRALDSYAELARFMT